MFALEQLENRILLSGDGLSAAAPTIANDSSISGISLEMESAGLIEGNDALAYASATDFDAMFASADSLPAEADFPTANSHGPIVRLDGNHAIEGDFSLSAETIFVFGHLSVSGTLNLAATQDIILGPGASISAGGITLQSGGDTLLQNGSSIRSHGGSISLLGDRVGLFGATVDSSSSNSTGGSILIGGNFHGGSGVQTAERTFVSNDSVINADGGANGAGGAVVIWSDVVTRFFGSLTSRGSEGGSVEISSAGDVVFRGEVDLTGTVGSGTLLFDPENITLTTNPDENTDGFDAATDLTEAFDDDAGVTSNFDVSAGTGSFSGVAAGTTIILEATGEINVDADFDIGLATGAENVSLVLSAGYDINLNAVITAEGTGTIGLYSDVIGTPDNVGSINISAAGGIVTANTSVTLQAPGISISDQAIFSAADISIISQTALELHNLTVTGTLLAESAASITASGVLVAPNLILTAYDSGTATYGDISATHSDNDFDTIQLTGAFVSITDLDGAQLKLIEVTGDLTGTFGDTVTHFDVDSIIVSGTAIFNLGFGDLTLTNATNDFFLLELNVAGNASIADANALELGTTCVGDTLTVTAEGAISSSSEICTPTAILTSNTDDAISLMSDDNTISNLSVDGGNTTIHGDSDIELTASNIAGDLTLTAMGMVTITTTEVSGSTVIDSNGNDLTATGTFGSVSALNSANVTWTDSTSDIELGDITATGFISVTASGSITASGVLSSGANATFSAGDASSISITNLANALIGTITLSATSDLQNVTLYNSTDITIDTLQLSGSLTMSSQGSISQTGPLTVAGLTSLEAIVDIYLTLSNDFSSISLVATSAYVEDANELILEMVAVSLDLFVTASGDITDTGSITVAEVGAIASFIITGEHDLILDHPDNDFDSILISARNAQITDSNELLLGEVTLTGDFDLLTTGSVYQGGGASVGGILSIDTGGEGDISLGHPDNNFFTVSIISAINVGIGDMDDLILGTSTILGELVIFAAGDITSTAPILVSGGAGIINFSTGSISLTNPANDFAYIGFYSDGSVTLVDVNDVEILDTDLLGDFSVTAGGEIYSSSGIIVEGTAVFDAGDCILLGSDFNDFNTIRVTTGCSVVIVDGNELVIGASTVGADLEIYTYGNLTQSGVLSVAGTTVLSVGDGNDILLHLENEIIALDIYESDDAEIHLVGEYDIVELDITGVLRIYSAGIKVYETPFITVQPASYTKYAGTSVTFSVIHTGTGPIGYQWQFNGDDIVGATDSSYRKADVQQGNEGTYTVLISNEHGLATSQDAVLTVVDGAPVITVQPVSQVKDAGTTVIFSVGDIGTGPLRYQWKFNGDNIPGATLYYYKKTNAQEGNAGTYTVVVTNDYGFDTSNDVTLTINAAAPVITIQPLSYIKEAGTNVTFSVAHTGSGPVSYQWKFNGDDIPGASLYYYKKTNVQEENVGTYTVVVTNEYGFATSNGATLGVTPGAPVITVQPLSYTKDAGTSVTFSAGHKGSTPISYQWKFNGDDIPGATLPFYKKTNLQSSNIGTYTVVITNDYGFATSNDATLDVIDVAPVITVQPLSYVKSAGTSVTFSVGHTGSGPMRYQWKFNGDDIPGATLYYFKKTNIQSSSEGTYSVVVTNDYGFVTSNDATLEVTDATPLITVQPVSYTKDAGTTVVFSVGHSGSGPATYQWQYNGDDIPGATLYFYRKTNVQAGNAGTYSVVVTNDFGHATSSDATLNVLDAAPLITVQPLSANQAAGSTVIFSVGHSGTAPATYQWKFNGDDIPGATLYYYKKTNVQEANIGTYSVVVTNDFGFATSNDATLAVTDAAPAITIQPVSYSKDVGSVVTFSVAHIGSSLVTYQWQFEGDDIPGATLYYYKKTNLLESNEGKYRVILTNDFGTVTSDEATLTINS